LTDFNCFEIQIGDCTASVKFSIIFAGIIENSNETSGFSGDGEFEMLQISESWFIQKFALPFSPE